MFQINDDKSIYVTRGDVLFFAVAADKDGEAYTFQPGDLVRIKVFAKKDCENVVLQKDFPVTSETEEVEIILDGADTKIGETISKPVDYWYEVELNPLSDPKTIIGYDEDGPKIFKLFPEGRDLTEDDPDIEPEDIPIVDRELDLTSKRPIENQAVARAVEQIKGNIRKNETSATEKFADISEKTNELGEKIAVERARIDNLVTPTTVDNELIDMRVGADGNVYGSAGGAVRTQASILKSNLKNLIRDKQTLWLHGNFVNGTLSSGVLNKNYRYRISTDTLISFDNKTTLRIADGFRLAIHEFSNNEFFADWGWRTVSVTINAGVHFKCMIARATDNTEEIADVLEFTEAITFNADHVRTKEAIDQSIFAIDNVKARYVFEPGDIKAETGRNIDVNMHRIRTHDICYALEDLVIVPNGLCRVYLYTYDDENYTNSTAHGWVTGNGTDYTIPAGTYFKLLVAHLDDSSVAYDAIEDVKASDIYRNLEIYTKKHKKHTDSLMAVNVPKSNIESVAHQGFSTTPQYFGNCRLSAIKGAYLNGFDYAEIDLKFTKDNVPVCCHDETFIDTNDNGAQITIANHTAEELKSYGYYGETISTFEEIVAECKRLGIGLYIDHISYINTDEKWNNVFSAIKKYGMANKVVWLSYNEKVSKWNKKARFAVVAHELTDTVVSNALSVANLGHEVYINVNHEACTVDRIIEYNAKLPTNINIGVWTIDDLGTYEVYKPYVCAITSNKLSDMMTNKK